MSWGILQYQWCTDWPLGRWKLAQGACNVDSSEDQNQVPFANRNGELDKSNGSDTKVTRIKKEVTLSQREIAKRKNQLHQAKENMAKERAEQSFKSKKEDSQDESPSTS